MTTLHLKKSIDRSHLRRGFTVVLLALAFFALPRTAPAVTPAPDGGYPNNNSAEGTNALLDVTTGGNNTANGFEALFNLTVGSNNTATGAFALFNLTTGGANTANGVAALESNTTGNANTANGFAALPTNTTGSANTANGVDALNRNTTGNDNTANGVAALESNTSGGSNTANGESALGSNTTGNANTANGFTALSGNTIGINNTANGVAALESNTTGSGNTASGFNALGSNTTAFNNTAMGQGSLQKSTTGASNTANGWHALFSNTTGASNIALGFNAGANLTTGSNNIDIGNVGVAGEAGVIRIGKSSTATFIAGISGKTVASGVGVIVNASGQLGTVLSSERFKTAIKPMDTASEAILALKPVTFHYKEELDPEKIPQFGLVAEQVEKVNPDLVVRGEDGKVMTVRYEAVNAMLLNEFLKEHRQVQELKTTAATQAAAISQQRAEFLATIAQQQKQIGTLTATVQKVMLALSKPAPQLVANP